MIKIKTPTLIIIIVLLLLIIFAVIFGGYKKPSPQPGPEEVVIAKEIYGISGTIESIHQNALIVDALILLKDPSKTPIRQKVNVLVNNEVKILVLKFPDPEDIPKGSTKPIYPPETEIKFNELKVGDKIDIQAKENISEKIKSNDSITASVINVIE